MGREVERSLVDDRASFVAYPTLSQTEQAPQKDTLKGSIDSKSLRGVLSPFTGRSYLRGSFYLLSGLHHRHDHENESLPNGLYNLTRSLAFVNRCPLKFSRSQGTGVRTPSVKREVVLPSSLNPLDSRNWIFSTVPLIFFSFRLY